MPKTEEPKKLIVVESPGAITELGGISGPVLNPCYVSIPLINRMINKHRAVYEVNPNNYSERIRLSLKNLRTKNFSSTAKETAPSSTTLAVVKNAMENNNPSPENTDDSTSNKPVSDFTKM